MYWIKIVVCLFSIVWGTVHLVDGVRNKKFRGIARPGPLKLIMGAGPYYEKALNFSVGGILVLVGIVLSLELLRII
ncbi:hypothetical protein D4L85_02105 [Chryseolinea soli]|uniref:Uncharacterized protein n=1 Tax=Chryseolinea soli TaxID=2321403 RepID=A0A385SGM4_9BACT|nr:hypothetical protein D4L85_02105 [Chryseolinea soli]